MEMIILKNLILNEMNKNELTTKAFDTEICTVLFLVRTFFLFFREAMLHQQLNLLLYAADEQT